MVAAADLVSEQATDVLYIHLAHNQEEASTVLIKFYLEHPLLVKKTYYAVCVALKKPYTINVKTLLSHSDSVFFLGGGGGCLSVHFYREKM